MGAAESQRNLWPEKGEDLNSSEEGLSAWDPLLSDTSFLSQEETVKKIGRGLRNS